MKLTSGSSVRSRTYPPCPARVSQRPLRSTAELDHLAQSTQATPSVPRASAGAHTDPARSGPPRVPWRGAGRCRGGTRSSLSRMSSNIPAFAIFSTSCSLPPRAQRRVCPHARAPAPRLAIGAPQHRFSRGGRPRGGAGGARAARGGAARTLGRPCRSPRRSSWAAHSAPAPYPPPQGTSYRARAPSAPRHAADAGARWSDVQAGAGAGLRCKVARGGGVRKDPIRYWRPCLTASGRVACEQLAGSGRHGQPSAYMTSLCSPPRKSAPMSMCRALPTRVALSALFSSPT